MSGDTNQPTDSQRIRLNVSDYLDASQDLSVANRKAAIAQEKMNTAVANLRALGGLDTLTNLGVKL